MKCDFCSDPNPVWVYPCADFAFEDQIHSAGNWAACQGCYELIESNQWRKLVLRSCQKLKAQHAEELYDIPLIVLANVHEAMYAQFRVCRSGKVKRLDKGEV